MTWKDFWTKFKAITKPILWIAGIFGAAIAALKGIQFVSKIIRDITEGSVKSPMPFGPTHGMPGHITVFAPWGEEVGELPPEMPIEKIKSAEAVKGGPIKVEVLHNARDRRSMLVDADCTDSGD